MEKRYTNIVGTPVIFDDGSRPVATVRDVIMDPERGTVIGLLVGRNKVIAPIDILEWSGVIRIRNWDSIAEIDDILRVAEVWKKGVRVFGNRVETEDGDNLGMVTDFAVDVNTNSLKKLYTAKGLLGIFRYDSRIISAKNIVEVLAKKIVIKENKEVKERKREFKPEAVA